MGIQGVAGLEDRVDRVAVDVKEMEDIDDADLQRDIAKCKASMEGARTRLTNLRTKVLPALQETGFDAVDLESASAAQGDPCPQVTGLLNEAEALVKEAETLGFEVLRVRRAFMELIAELGPSREEARCELESLTESAARCEAEEMKDVTSEMKKAADFEMKMETILSKAKDPDAFKVAHKQYCDQVKQASAAVQAGLKELERREQERAQRNAIDATLDAARSQVNDCLKRLEMAVVQIDTHEADTGSLLGLRTEITKMQTGSLNVAIDELQTKADAKTAETSTLTGEIDKKNQEFQEHRRAGFKSAADFWKNKQG